MVRVCPDRWFEFVLPSQYNQQDSGEPPVFAMVARDGVEIHFGKADQGVEILTNESVRRGLGTEAYIWVSDIDSLYEELSAKDVEILEGPVKRIYDCIEVVVRDCNGFQLVFAV